MTQTICLALTLEACALRELPGACLKLCPLSLTNHSHGHVTRAYMSEALPPQLSLLRGLEPTLSAEPANQLSLPTLSALQWCMSEAPHTKPISGTQHLLQSLAGPAVLGG
jgi:hypothetical protein